MPAAWQQITRSCQVHGIIGDSVSAVLSYWNKSVCWTGHYVLLSGLLFVQSQVVEDSELAIRELQKEIELFRCEKGENERFMIY